MRDLFTVESRVLHHLNYLARAAAILTDITRLNFFEVSSARRFLLLYAVAPLSSAFFYCIVARELLGRAQPVIPPNLYSENIIAWGPRVTRERFIHLQTSFSATIQSTEFAD